MCLITLTLLILAARSSNVLRMFIVFSCIKSSIFFFKTALSSIVFLIACRMFGTLLNNSRIVVCVSWSVSRSFSAFSAVTASMRRIPAATELSATMRSIPIQPVAFTCVPPHNSIDEPYLITRTSSPYFSPNNAIAPNSRASAIGILRYSCNEIFWRIFLFTKCSTFRISSAESFWKCEKSNRNEFAET